MSLQTRVSFEWACSSCARRFKQDPVSVAEGAEFPKPVLPTGWIRIAGQVFCGGHPPEYGRADPDETAAGAGADERVGLEVPDWGIDMGLYDARLRHEWAADGRTVILDGPELEQFLGEFDAAPVKQKGQIVRYWCERAAREGAA
jgi:hypothetical protein